MAVIDEFGQGWVFDPKAGRPVKFGTPRSAEIRAEEFEGLATKLQTDAEVAPSTPIEDGKAIRIAKDTAAMLRKAAANLKK